LSRRATRSSQSLGRKLEEAQCDIRTVFARDRDRILHSKAFRRLKDKTQVFLIPTDDHFRNRLTHTLEVSQNARTIAKALNLNEDLTEAIALGHDLGHTPFGHIGERVLHELCIPFGFSFHHNEQSIRVVEHLEKDGAGLNLTCEVLDGILNHRSINHPSTLEGQIVRYSDKIAYIYHDSQDATRGGLISESDFPKDICAILGYTAKERLNSLIHNLIANSVDSDTIKLSHDYEKAFSNLKNFMFYKVYSHEKAKIEDKKAQNLIAALFRYYQTHLEAVPVFYKAKALELGEANERAVCDYIASMTDHFAITLYEELFVPKAWR